MQVSNIEKIKQKTKQLAVTVAELVELVKATSLDDLSGQNCVQVVCGARQILGHSPLNSYGVDWCHGSPLPSFTQSDDLFWSDPDNIAAMDEIVRAIQCRAELKDWPSFDLGVSQDVAVGDCPVDLGDRIGDGVRPTANPTDQPSVLEVWVSFLTFFLGCYVLFS